MARRAAAFPVAVRSRAGAISEVLAVFLGLAVIIAVFEFVKLKRRGSPG
jgi:hypothetical protein